MTTKATTAGHEPVVVDYYSDLLCIWAWIAQRRLDELSEQLGDQVRVHFHFMDVFGDAHGKIRNQWHARGGFDGFADHVAASAGQFDHLAVHPELWRSVRPHSSAPAHLFIKAVQLAYGEGPATALALTMRRAFFENGVDIGQWPNLLGLAEQHALTAAGIESAVASGQAYAALMADYQKAKREGLKGSPSYLLDGGRQVLFGNVGYRILSANVEELLRKPAGEASWC
ncbi:DsbA family protein [Halioxenophilus sp. WMMB6]|uniref:DsbA family oxidoreductase n=1 Tax=Halioxenophilus sp. WMMB6 TaxID=3073815 RepID=UPI00295F4AA0|nr:DsbA family protein [Halioxenophilus sp. WMMB6]